MVKDIGNTTTTQEHRNHTATLKLHSDTATTQQR
ncbi:hypothetical protein FHX77_000842 [Bifidobacterium commune]|nr:hypothetical protein [Bifidobacterium commune]